MKERTRDLTKNTKTRTKGKIILTFYPFYPGLRTQ